MKGEKGESKKERERGEWRGEKEVGSGDAACFGLCTVAEGNADGKR